LKNQKKIPALTVIMVSFCFLALLSSGILYYSSGMTNISEAVKPALENNEIEKESILEELNDLRKNYDEIILENKTMSVELNQEREKVIELMSDLAVLHGKYDLAEYQNQVKVLQDKLKKVILENEKLKEQNVSITEQNKIIKEKSEIAEVALKESQKQSEGLKRDLANTVEKSSKLAVSGTIVIAYKLKTSGELVITEKANKVDGINISFVIAKNEMAKPVDKVYYVQVINSENTVLGDVNEGVHQYKSLTYSLAMKVSYENKMIHVSENFLGNKFVKGTYYVNIYDKEELVDESSFALK